MKPTILVTGFTAFQEFDRNPSGDIAETVNGKQMNGFRVKGIRLPVSWHSAWPLIRKNAETLKPAAWLGFGLAPDPFLRLETTARNEARNFYDEFGKLPLPTGAGEIIAGHTPTIPSALPLDWLREKLLIRNFATLGTYPLEVRYSDDAGGYICNHVFYLAMSELQEKIPVRGFIHVPPYTRDTAAGGPGDKDLIDVGLFIVECLAEWLAGEKTGE